MSGLTKAVNLSVVIATFQGEKRILTTLKSLETQTFKDFEAVIVIDGSSDNTASVIRAANLQLDLKIVVQVNKGRAGARNTGVAYAKADVIVFFDDDVVVPPSALLLYYTRWQKQIPVAVGSFYPIATVQNEFAKYCAYLNNKWSVSVLSKDESIMTRPYLSAANCMIDKKIFKSVNGFDETLRDAEDFDLAVRLFKANIQILYIPEISVGHAIQQNFKQYAERLKQYKFAQQALKKRNRGVNKFMSADYKMTWLKRVCFVIVSNHFFVNLIDVGLFRFLPLRFRFKVYDVILTGFTV